MSILARDLCQLIIASNQIIHGICADILVGAYTSDTAILLRCELMPTFRRQLCLGLSLNINNFQSLNFKRFPNPPSIHSKNNIQFTALNDYVCYIIHSTDPG
jgi:hypothetical protein